MAGRSQEEPEQVSLPRAVYNKLSAKVDELVEDFKARGKGVPSWKLFDKAPDAKPDSPDEHSPQVFINRIWEKGNRLPLEAVIVTRLNNAEGNPPNPAENTIVVAHVKLDAATGQPQLANPSNLYEVMSQDEFRERLSTDDRTLESEWLKGHLTQREYRERFEGQGGFIRRSLGMTETLDQYWDKQDLIARGDPKGLEQTHEQTAELVDRLSGRYNKLLQNEVQREGALLDGYTQELVAVKARYDQVIEALSVTISQLIESGNLQSRDSSQVRALVAGSELSSDETNHIIDTEFEKRKWRRLAEVPSE